MGINYSNYKKPHFENDPNSFFKRCELAQAFQRFGSQVYLLGKGNQLLAREDPEASSILQKTFDKEGIITLLTLRFLKIEKRNNEKVIYIETNGEKKEIVVDEILIATGRQPNVEV